MDKKGGVLVTVRDSDKFEIVDVVRKYAELGFDLYATEGTAKALEAVGLSVHHVAKISDGTEENTVSLMEKGKISYVISTDSKGRLPQLDSVKMRRKAVELSVPCLTAIDTAKVLVETLRSGATLDDVELIDISTL